MAIAYRTFNIPNIFAFKSKHYQHVIWSLITLNYQNLLISIYFWFFIASRSWNISDKRISISFRLIISSFISSFMINVWNASITIHRWGGEEVAPLKNRHQCRMHETSRARNIARNASRVAVSPRDVSRNMRALEESEDERGHPSFLVSFKPISRDS